MMAVLTIVLVAGMLPAALADARAGDAVGPLVLEIHPYLPADEVVRRFTPLADLAARALGRPVTIAVAPDYDAHVRRIADGDVDIAYLGPAAYVGLRAGNATPRLLARQAIDGRPVFHGYVVARVDSAVTSLADLAGRSVAFGDERSTMSHVVPYAMMLEAGVHKRDLARFAFVGSHKNVALGVLAGAFDAGGVKEEVYHAYKDHGLKVVAKSPPVSEHLFVATRRLDPETAEAARRFLLSLHEDPAGRRALRAIKTTISALLPVTDADYDPLRRMMGLVRGAQ
jgi:phosphonate transport system substrate-binding protein